MAARTKTSEQFKLCSGNEAAAYGALVSRPDVIALYPITPQTQIVEWLARFHAQGLLNAEIVEVEGENSAMAVVSSAAVAGARVFTATSSWGLAFMSDGLFYAAARRIPVVMVNVNRETPGLPTIGCGRQDIMSVRDIGWVQIEVENCQEILDSVIMAYRIAEDTDILLPVMICYDGFYLSYLEERVTLPRQDDVDCFLAELNKNERIKLGPDKPRAFGGGYSGEACSEFRYKHCLALERVKQKIEETDTAFTELFGRSYGGPLEEYRTHDAEVVLLTMGSSTGTARVAIDEMRNHGLKVGLIKLRLMRPFPKERLVQALSTKKAVGVVDRSVCFGWNCGHLFMELKAALCDTDKRPVLLDFIGGLANTDITVEHLTMASKLTHRASQGETVQPVTWLTLE